MQIERERVKMGVRRLLTVTNWKMVGKKRFMNSVGFDFGREIFLEAITPLMGFGWYFVKGMRFVP